MSLNSNGHDIVVVGASAGGVDALIRLAAGLPEDFAAAVFVVLHMRADRPSALASILQRSGLLPAVAAEHMLPIEHGKIYVSVPSKHLVVHRGHMLLEAGPRENSARPSVDVLFRSAARAYGRRVVGVILSGTLQDGALGLAAIKMRGGVTIVQDPDEALFSGMPESAMRTTSIDYRLTAADIPPHLVQLTLHTIEHPAMESSEANPSEITIHAADEPEGALSPKLANAASGLTCPECHGSLWELDDGNSSRFECRIGHSYSVESFLAEQGETVEAALWAAVNALQERAAMFRRFGDNASSPLAGRYEERAEVVEGHADALLDLLRGLIAQGHVG